MKVRLVLPELLKSPFFFPMNVSNEFHLSLLQSFDSVISNLLTILKPMSIKFAKTSLILRGGLSRRGVKVFSTNNHFRLNHRVFFAEV